MWTGLVNFGFFYVVTFRIGFELDIPPKNIYEMKFIIVKDLFKSFGLEW